MLSNLIYSWLFSLLNANYTLAEKDDNIEFDNTLGYKWFWKWPVLTVLWKKIKQSDVASLLSLTSTYGFILLGGQ